MQYISETFGRALWRVNVLESAYFKLKKDSYLSQLYPAISLTYNFCREIVYRSFSATVLKDAPHTSYKISYDVRNLFHKTSLVSHINS